MHLNGNLVRNGMEVHAISIPASYFDLADELLSLSARIATEIRDDEIASALKRIGAFFAADFGMLLRAGAEDAGLERLYAVALRESGFSCDFDALQTLLQHAVHQAFPCHAGRRQARCLRLADDPASIPGRRRAGFTSRTIRSVLLAQVPAGEAAYICALACHRAGCVWHDDQAWQLGLLARIVTDALSRRIARQPSALGMPGFAGNRDESKDAIRQRHARLTNREREVMEHVIEGQLNKQIAADLNISVKTVKVHRARAMEKMGVRTVAALVLACYSAGIGLDRVPQGSPDRSGQDRET
jgi:DNA-binding CsgD family transcriptional regulator